jgi:hypothetical protein
MGALEDIHLNIQMQLTHALDDGLAALDVGLDPEGGVLLDHLIEGHAQLLGTTLVAGGDGDGDDRVGEDHGLQGGGVLGVAEGVAGLGTLHAEQGHDVTSLGGLQFRAGIGVHLDDTTDPLGLAGEGIEHRVALLDTPE